MALRRLVMASSKKEVADHMVAFLWSTVFLGPNMTIMVTMRVLPFDGEEMCCSG